MAISLKKTGLLRFTRNDDSLNRDLGGAFDPLRKQNGRRRGDLLLRP